MFFGAVVGARAVLACVGGGGGRLLVAVGAALGLSAFVFSPAAAAACQTGSLTFLSTGAEQCYAVPAGVSSVQVVAVGAPGGTGVGLGAGTGGLGGMASGGLSVFPGEVLYIEVGRAGNGGSSGAGGGGGFNGGATAGGFEGGGGGGGASDVRTISCGTPCDPLQAPTLGSRLLIAAGGGGGGGAALRGSGNGGAAGAGGGSGSGSTGGGAGAGGTTGGPGGGGAAGSGACATATGGSSGLLGEGGAGGGAAGAFGSGGGGGGGGYFGGGGGGGAENNAACGSGGAGGGSSFGPPGATFGMASSSTSSVTITPLTALAQVSPSGLTFATQPQSTVSAPQTVTITNNGRGSLAVSGLSFAGADPGDFFIASSTCGGQIPSGSSCQVTVSFAPQAQGARSANLVIASDDLNSPASVPLSGTGGSLPQGPAGATGPTGPTGAAGRSGRSGRCGRCGRCGWGHRSSGTGGPPWSARSGRQSSARCVPHDRDRTRRHWQRRHRRGPRRPRKAGVLDPDHLRRGDVHDR